MNQQHYYMTHSTEVVIALNGLLFLTHFLDVFRGLLVVLSLLYVVYNIRLQIIDAGGFKKYLKSFFNWKSKK